MPKPTRRTNTGPLDDKKWDELLHTHIPDRLRELVWCSKLAAHSIAHGNPKHISIQTAPGKGYETGRFEWLFHPAYDTGILMCRVMMEFLGIGYRVHTMFQKREPPIDRMDDVCLLDFGIQFITVADAAAGGPTARDALLNTLLAANKGIGHLTRAKASDLDLPDLKLACEQVVSLVNHHLYQKLNMTNPSFDTELIRST
jgi:hypothetical protein